MQTCPGHHKASSMGTKSKKKNTVSYSQQIAANCAFRRQVRQRRMISYTIAWPEMKIPVRSTPAPSTKVKIDATVSISLKSKIPQSPLTKMPVCQIETAYVAGSCAKRLVGSEALTAMAYSTPKGPSANTNPETNPHGNTETKPQSLSSGSESVVLR